MDTDLATKMLAVANRDNLPQEHILRTLAEDFECAVKGFFGEPKTCDVKKFMGCWARARKAWCEYTGEPLI